jgi:hypothetical protein
METEILAYVVRRTIFVTFFSFLFSFLFFFLVDANNVWQDIKNENDKST